MIEELPRSDGSVGNFCGGYLVINWYRRAQLTEDGTIPRQVLLDCVKKIAKREPGTEPQSKLASRVPHDFCSKFLS